MPWNLTAAEAVELERRVIEQMAAIAVDCMRRGITGRFLLQELNSRGFTTAEVARLSDTAQKFMPKEQRHG